MDMREPVADYLVGLGAKVRRYRDERRISRRVLSGHAGISERYLAQLELGDANISIALLWQLAQALEVGVDSLLPGEAISANSASTACTRVALLGLRGAGKTTLGTAIGEALGLSFVRLTDLIEQTANLAVAELFSLGGQKAYHRIEQQALTGIVDRHEAVILETGGSLVSSPDTFALLQREFYTVWVTASPEEHMQRVIAQGDLRPMENNPDAMDELNGLLREREPAYRQANYVLSTAGRSVGECVEELTGELTRVLDLERSERSQHAW